MSDTTPVSLTLIGTSTDETSGIGTATLPVLYVAMTGAPSAPVRNVNVAVPRFVAPSCKLKRRGDRLAARRRRRERERARDAGASRDDGAVVLRPLGDVTPPVACSVATRFAVFAVPMFRRPKLTVTVSPGSIALLAGAQLSAVSAVAPPAMTGRGASATLYATSAKSWSSGSALPGTPFPAMFVPLTLMTREPVDPGGNEHALDVVARVRRAARGREGAGEDVPLVRGPADRHLEVEVVDEGVARRRAGRVRPRERDAERLGPGSRRCP